MLHTLATLLTSSQGYLPQEKDLLWIPVTTVLWFLLRWSLAAAGTPQAGRVTGIIHAIITVSCGYPILLLLLDGPFTMDSLFSNFVAHQRAFRILGHSCCYLSCGYFIMDSAYIWRTPYLKHHVGATAAWIVVNYSHETYVIHGIVLISLFETGAILVQLSRMFGKVLFFRTLICMGYSGTRLALTLYYIFTIFVGVWLEPASNPLYNVYNVFMHCAMVFLLSLNWRWVTLQWMALIKAYRAQWDITKAHEVEDFFVYHQKILGNTGAVSPPATATTL